MTDLDRRQMSFSQLERIEQVAVVVKHLNLTTNTSISVPEGIREGRAYSDVRSAP